MHKRALRISLVTLALLCSCFFICTGVFAATRHSTNINTIVQFTPGIQVIVYMTVDNNQPTKIFDNVNGVFVDTPSVTSNQQVRFTVENHTENATVAVSLKYADSHNGWYFADTTTTAEIVAIDGVIEETSTNIAAHTTQTPSFWESNNYHLIALFENTTANIVIALEGQTVN